MIQSELSEILKNSIEDIILSQENFHLLPRNSSGRCVYRGELSISGKNVKKLPDNFTVNGNLNCANNGMEELPIGLEVFGDLNCFLNSITDLPKDLTVTKDLFCFNNLLEDVPESIVVGGNIYCYGNNMDVFRIIEKNTKRIIDEKYKPKNKLPIIVTFGEEDKLVLEKKEAEEAEEKKLKEEAEKEEKRLKEEKEKLEKEAKEAEELRLEEEKMANMSESHREIYIRVTAIKKKRKTMTTSRYSHYGNYYGY